MERCLFLARKAMTNLDSILKSRDITLLREVCLVSSAQFSCSVMSDSLQPHGPAAHQASLSITNSGIYSDSCPSSQQCHLTISSSVVPFSYCLQSFPASGSFQMSQLFASGGQSIGVSASTSVLPMNIQDWFPLGWTDWISLLSKGLSRVFSNTTVQKHKFFGTQAFFIVQLSRPYMTTGKTIALTQSQNLCWQSNISAF